MLPVTATQCLIEVVQLTRMTGERLATSFLAIEFWKSPLIALLKNLPCIDLGNRWYTLDNAVMNWLKCQLLLAHRVVSTRPGCHDDKTHVFVLDWRRSVRDHTQQALLSSLFSKTNSCVWFECQGTAFLSFLELDWHANAMTQECILQTSTDCGSTVFVQCLLI